MADTVKVTVRKGHLNPEDRTKMLEAGESVTVDKVRAAEGRASGIYEPETPEAETFWIDSQGNKRPHTGALQEVGRPNAEPPPESDSPAPGDGTFTLAPEPTEIMKPGTVNQEAPNDNEIVSPAPGTGEFSVQGAGILVENPDSLLPESPFVTRDPAKADYRTETAEKTPEVPMEPVDPVSTVQRNEDIEESLVREATPTAVDTPLPEAPAEEEQTAPKRSRRKARPTDE